MTLTFNNTTATIVSNEDGMFDLNDIWRVFDLRASKQPSQWRNEYRRHLTTTANLRACKGKEFGVNHTWATKKALFAYAAWVDVEFHMVVVEAFAALTD